MLLRIYTHYIVHGALKFDCLHFTGHVVNHCCGNLHVEFDCVFDLDFVFTTFSIIEGITFQTSKSGTKHPSSDVFHAFSSIRP